MHLRLFGTHRTVRSQRTERANKINNNYHTQNHKLYKMSKQKSQSNWDIGQAEKNGWYLETEDSWDKTLQYPNWLYTCFFDDESEYNLEWATTALTALNECAVYHIGGREVCPRTGRDHVQGYVQFKRKQRLSQLVKLTGTKRIHWLPARGDETDNTAYCSKEGNILINFGTARTTNGGKSAKLRWDEAKQLAIEGKIEDIQSQLYICHFRTLELIAKKHKPKVADLEGELMNYWIYGPTGSGKSRLARQKLIEWYGEDGWYLKMQNKWWDAYKGEEGVLIDDLEKEWGRMAIAQLKSWFDRYKFHAELKGTTDPWIRPQQFIVTSNFHPYQIWGDHWVEWYQPMMRRFKIIYWGDGEQPVWPDPEGDPLPTVPTFNTNKKVKYTDIDM